MLPEISKPLFSRRNFLFSLAAVVVSAGAITLSTGIKDWIHAEISEAFGETVGEHKNSAEFVRDFLEHLSNRDPHAWFLSQFYFRAKPQFFDDLMDHEDVLRSWVIELFVHSTNIVKYEEGDEPFTYSGLFLPHVTPCVNQLSAHA